MDTHHYHNTTTKYSVCTVHTHLLNIISKLRTYMNFVLPFSQCISFCVVLVLSFDIYIGMNFVIKVVLEGTHFCLLNKTTEIEWRMAAVGFF